MKEIIKKELIEDLDNYIILHNGKVIEHSSKIDSLNITESIDLKVIHIVDEDMSLDINIDSNLEVKIDEVFYCIENNPKINIKINIEKNSKLNYLSFKKTKKGTNTSALVNAYLKENSYISNKNLSIFSTEVDLIQNVFLNSINSKCDMKNVYINSSGKTQNYSVNVHHNYKNTISDMKNFGICNNDSILNLNSNGIIKKGSKKTELRQKAKGLLLDLTSNISANPLLEINDFDCIASHGASIGAIDEDELYYLMSRGLSKQEAEKLIISGFLYPFLSEIEEGKLQDYIKSWIDINI